MTPIVGNIKDVDVVADCLDRYGSDVLDVLLKDRTTGRNIIWADDEYVKLGEGYGAYDEITVEKISAGKLIEPRVAKAVDQQTWRTKEKAEVFTPSWLCKKMVDCLDDDFFGCEPSGFEGEGNTGLTAARYEQLAEDERWKDYVDNRLLEITCGEAPFICSPYIATTGEFVSVEARVGFLDRKLNVVTRFTGTCEEWLEWAVRAVQATYGYEYQGDNLLIARINVLNTVADFMRDAWERGLGGHEAMRVADVISWNLWQMDGLRGCAPSEWDLPPKENIADAQMSFFDMGLFGEEDTEEDNPQTKIQFADKCTIFDWQANVSLNYEALSEGVRGSMKQLFYAIIGNPPYQEETDSDSTRMPPIYNHFMDQSYDSATKVELITPARFLFDAGYTPGAWNKKMLSDEHLKVLHYEPKSDKVFSGTDIKGGVAVTYRDSTKQYGAIETFTAFSELNGILNKVKLSNSAAWLSEVIYSPLSYQLSELMLRENPDSVGRLRTSAFEKLSQIFFEEDPNDGHEYVAMVGLLNGKRTSRFVRRDYLKTPDNFEYYKVMVPKSNGSGALGEVLSTPLIGQPLIGHTQTFISIGKFCTNEEAQSCLKYIKSKFARTMLGVLKITQDNPAPKWRYVPLQDFTSSSDIDWSQSVAEIDAQLYAKYGLSQEEIDFIESHVKEMN